MGKWGLFPAHALSWGPVLARISTAHHFEPYHRQNGSTARVLGTMCTQFGKEYRQYKYSLITVSFVIFAVKLLLYELSRYRCMAAECMKILKISTRRHHNR